MGIDADLVRQLVEHPESETLDVKGGQYRFIGGTDDDKSELLKDVMALANSFNAEDAYILVGVRESKPAPHVIVGIDSPLDDASLQQFIHAKVERSIQFSYQQVDVNGFTVGVFRVPPQRGPFVLRKDFGRLSKSLLPLRQGTSTKYVSIDKYVELAQEHARASSPRTTLLAVDSALASKLAQFQELVSGSADSVFERCTELLRLGEVADVNRPGYPGGSGL